MKDSGVPLDFQAQMLTLADQLVYRSEADTEKALELLERVISVFADQPPYLILNALAVAYEGTMQLLWENQKQGGGVDLSKLDLDIGKWLN